MKRLVSLALALALCCGLVPAALAASTPVASSNINDHWYVNAQRWAAPIASSLSYENSGYVRAECVGSELVIEYYNLNFKFRSGKTIPLELPLYGGVYMDEDYNFLVVGQENREENDSKEVFRIIRYTKDWEKVDHASIYGANTTVPFDAGSLRFERSGDILYIRTCHEMYTSEDGYNHQANVMIALKVSTMTVTDQLTRAWNNKYGYVSHSFNQFLQADGNTLLAVDHGDAHPRSVCLFRYEKKAGSDTFYGRTAMVNVLPIVESTGHYNDTGASVGGFAFSATDYLIAGSSCDQTQSTDLMYAHRNIFVTATPKDDFTDEATRVNWITDYAESDGIEVSPPHLLKVNENRFFLTWTENDVMKYCFLDGRGRMTGDVRTTDYALSDCAPILADGCAVWYVTDGSEPVFYRVWAEECTHSYVTHMIDPTCTREGATAYTCKVCGDSYSEAIPALGHDWHGTACSRCGQSRKTPFDDVQSGSFYEEPVAWAVENSITNGISATAFGALADCNRAQVVTFLWRAAGCPRPRSQDNPFEDVQSGSFYEQAVLWAVEEGITNGLSATRFGPNENCNRAQVVTFLWRAQGSPDIGGANRFVDVGIGSWFEMAINWALEEGITNGLDSTHFGVGTVCNRAQIVTFLYRTFN